MNPGVKVCVTWTHNPIYRGQDQAHVPFDELTNSEFTLGFIKLLANQMDKETRHGLNNTVSRAMLEFFQQWPDDTQDICGKQFIAM